MGVGAFIEPLVVVILLFGGAFLNRNRTYKLTLRVPNRYKPSSSGFSSPTSEDGLLSPPNLNSPSSSPGTLEPVWRKRQLHLFGWRTEVISPNCRVFKEHFLSRVLKKYPFLVESWYWALIYWVYQLGRALGALTLVEGTVDISRRHALELIRIEQNLHIFWEIPIQKWFLTHPQLMHWTNRIYSFIHIPGTILFLVALYWYTTTRTRGERSSMRFLPTSYGRSRSPSPRGKGLVSPTIREIDDDDLVSDSNVIVGPALYKARRRTMAMCNLVAFIIFTAWPCMPPRLLSDPNVPGPIGSEARQYGFVDTVHGAEGESSVWTQNKFCNQYAAMPSLHFGYSLLIGLTIMTIPLSSSSSSRRMSIKGFGRVKVPCLTRMVCLVVGFSYPTIILMAIVATANHFILDAVAGALVCAVAWKGNGLLLNLVPLEDYFLWCVGIHKPEKGGAVDDGYEE